MLAETYHYNFEAELPSNIPASFEKFGKYYGCIHYDISVYLEVSQEVQKEFKINFYVLNDLNKFSDIQIPCKETLFKKFCCLFCKSEPLTLSVTIPFSGFIPGSTVPILIRYNNESDVEIGRTIITVLCVIKYKR